MTQEEREALDFARRVIEDKAYRYDNLSNRINKLRGFMKQCYTEADNPASENGKCVYLSYICMKSGLDIEMYSDEVREFTELLAKCLERREKELEAL